MKKLLKKYTILSFALMCGFWCVCRWQLPFWENWNLGRLDPSFPIKGDWTVNNLECDNNTDLWNCTSIKEDEKKEWSDTIIRRLLWVFGLKADKKDDLKFIDYARAILNMTLGLIALIAFIMTIYTFYMIFFSENEAWIKKAKWNLIGIFIALGIVWLAWLIVSFIFWWYQANWKQHEDNIETWDVAGVWEFYYE